MKDWRNKPIPEIAKEIIEAGCYDITEGDARAILWLDHRMDEELWEDLVREVERQAEEYIEDRYEPPFRF